MSYPSCVQHPNERYTACKNSRTSPRPVGSSCVASSRRCRRHGGSGSCVVHGAWCCISVSQNKKKRHCPEEKYASALNISPSVISARVVFTHVILSLLCVVYAHAQKLRFVQIYAFVVPSTRTHSCTQATLTQASHTVRKLNKKSMVEVQKQRTDLGSGPEGG